MHLLVRRASGEAAVDVGDEAVERPDAAVDQPAHAPSSSGGTLSSIVAAGPSRREVCLGYGASMRILVVGATGVIGRELVQRLVAAGHAVTGTSRSPAGVDAVRALGAQGRVLDVYDEATVGDALAASDPEVLVCQVSDLPDSADDLPARRAANARIRHEAIPRLLAAVRAHGVGQLLVQSVAWPMTGEGAEAVAVMEEATLAAGGVVLRYGQFYGPGTFHARSPDGPAVAVGDAAARTADLLLEPSSVVTITDAPTPATSS